MQTILHGNRKESSSGLWERLHSERLCRSSDLLVPVPEVESVPESRPRLLSRPSDIYDAARVRAMSRIRTVVAVLIWTERQPGSGFLESARLIVDASVANCF
jgi:hypothetical protein